MRLTLVARDYAKRAAKLAGEPSENKEFVFRQLQKTREILRRVREQSRDIDDVRVADLLRTAFERQEQAEASFRGHRFLVALRMTNLAREMAHKALDMSRGEPGTGPEQVRAALGRTDEVLGRGGAPDVLVNAAGWDRAGPFLENSLEFMDRVVRLNLLGPVKLTKALLPAMIEAGAGKIVNVASDAGRVGSSGETIYAGAKGGVIAFTKSLAREMARYGINVNCVCPGPTETPLFRSLPERTQQALERAIPFRRLAKPEEVADAILFFASPRSDFITGQVLSVSGGLTMAG